jgi:hypothetical protein
LLDFQLILSITAQSIFAVEPSAWARLKGILIENLTKIENKKNNNNNFLFYLGSLKMELPKNLFLILFKLGKLVEDYHLLLPLKPLEGDFCLFKKYRFLNMVTSEIFSVLWKYLSQFFFLQQSEKITTTNFEESFHIKSTRGKKIYLKNCCCIFLFFLLKYL